MRSFGSSRPSLLGPSRGPSPGLSGGYRPPPIRTVASLEGGGQSSFDNVEAFLNGVMGGGGLAPPSVLVAPSPIFSQQPSTPSSRAPPATPRFSGASTHHHMMGGGGARARGTVAPMSLVAPNVYVGDEAAAADLNALTAAGVTHVLNCTAMPSALEGMPGAPVFAHLGLMDNTSDLPRMQQAMTQGADFVEAAVQGGGTILIHCHRGISRSATIAIAYLVRATQQPAESVFEQLRACRRVIDPNLGYWVALKTWEQTHLPASALRRAGSATPSRSSTPTRTNSFGTVSSAMTPPGVRPLSRAG